LEKQELISSKISSTKEISKMAKDKDMDYTDTQMAMNSRDNGETMKNL
jgi:hypothetical protein